jgi:hypothetical protein
VHDSLEILGFEAFDAAVGDHGGDLEAPPEGLQLGSVVCRGGRTARQEHEEWPAGVTGLPIEEALPVPY